MIKNALFCLSFCFISLFEAVEYDIVVLAPKGEELTTESNYWWPGQPVKINEAGYVIGTYQNAGDYEHPISYVYHKELGFKIVGLPNEALSSSEYDGIQSINNKGTAVGTYGNCSSQNYWSYKDLHPKIFIFEAKTGKCYDLLDEFGLSEVENFSLNGIIVNQIIITDDNKVIVDCDNSNTYIYDLNLKAVSLLKDGGLVAVNQKGQMIGAGWFYDPRSGVEDLGSLDQFNRWKVEPQALSQNGVVAGMGMNSYGENCGFIWSTEKGLVSIDISGNFPRIFSVNDKDGVLGDFEIDAEEDYFTHAFLYTLEEGFLDLGTLGGLDCRPKAINNKSQVVGRSETPRYEQDRAFIWDAKNGMRDLSTLIPQKAGWKVLEEAVGINDSGCIVGYGRYYGVDHHFLLVPKKP